MKTCINCVELEKDSVNVNYICRFSDEIIYNPEDRSCEDYAERQDFNTQLNELYRELEYLR